MPFQDVGIVGKSDNGGIFDRFLLERLELTQQAAVAHVVRHVCQILTTAT